MAETDTDGLIRDLSEVARLAQARQDEFEVVMYRLQDDDSLDDAGLDARVQALADPIIAAIDCTQCANCCRSLNVYLEESDAERLAQGLDIPLSEIGVMVDHEQARLVGEWGRFKAIPCAFLRGTRCGVYPHRPNACRQYPQFTPDFRWVLDDLVDGAGLCPIIYNTLSALSEQIDDWLR